MGQAEWSRLLGNTPISPKNDFETDDREELKARLQGAQAFAQALLTGYHALRSYGVDFMSLREWKDVGEIDEARKLKPQAMSEKVLAYCMRLENAIKAAINRKVNIKLHTDNTTRGDPPTKH